jgi:3-hydroxyisobutyrate dehydrogenase
MTQRVAILGLGTMGFGMATNLLTAGIPTTVWNRTRAKAEPLAAAGARIADTPADAARDADIILTMLADETASRTAWLGEHGALAAAKPNTILIESSTVTPEWIAELAAAASKRNLRFLDAPVTGSRMQAAAGQLSFLVGGDPSTLEEARPVLAAMSKEIVPVGPIGSGARLKLINNFLCGVQIASLAEAMVWIERGGLDRTQALRFLTTGAPGSPLLGVISARMAAQNYEVNFLLRLLQKDMNYAIADANTLNLDLRTARTAEARMAEAVTAGHGEQDMSAVVESVRST